MPNRNLPNKRAEKDPDAWLVIADVRRNDVAGGGDAPVAEAGGGLSRLAGLAADLGAAPRARIAVSRKFLRPAPDGIGAHVHGERLPAATVAALLAAPASTSGSAPVVTALREAPPGQAPDIALHVVVPIQIDKTTVGALLLDADAATAPPDETMLRRLRTVAAAAADNLRLQHRMTFDRKAAANAAFLQRELNHQVRNTLAVLQSIASQTLRHTQDPEKFRATFSRRMRALAEIHGLLAEQSPSAVSMEAIIERLVVPALPLHAAQLKIGGPSVGLPADQAIGVALALNELSVNAVAHGALRTRSGSVDISWTLETEPKPAVLLTWTEEGVAPLPPRGQDRFGNVIIRHSLDKIVASRVDMDYRPDGLQVRFRIPLS